MSIPRWSAGPAWILAVLAVSATALTDARADDAITLSYPTDSQPIRYGAQKLAAALEASHPRIRHRHWPDTAPTETDVLVLRYPNDLERPETGLESLDSDRLDSLESDGFHLARPDQESPTLIVIARDETGAMYGLLEAAEQIRLGTDLTEIPPQQTNPEVSFRAIKFNLPWSSYRSDEAMDLHLSTCRDLDFWERFLDMMAENRFNTLSLWNLHPFPFMIRPTDFPEATPFDDRELASWKRFWKALFAMAEARGIDTYIVNWNIVVSPAMAQAYDVDERNDTSDLVRRYTRQCVTQVLNEYPKLTGYGVTLADWMDGMTPREREDWIEETFIRGIQEADRPARFIHRSVLTASPSEMRRVIDRAGFEEPVWVPVKFNWSHGHSTPDLALTHDYTDGRIDRGYWDPEPTNYRIVWTVRNEDFFILRWGNPDFIRQHIEQNARPYVDGYMIGSEGFVPAKDLSHVRHPHQTWQYAFEKQWLFYKLWGRLLYDPETPDERFAALLADRYGEETGQPLLRAYSLAGRMPLELASFHAGTWDFTLYSEGFLAPARSFGHHDGDPFISIDELIDHPTLDPDYLSIPDFLDLEEQGSPIPDTQVTPPELAARLHDNASSLDPLLDSLQTQVTPYTGALECELMDMATWQHLSRYFADKLQAGVAWARYRRSGDPEAQERAVTLLNQCVDHWENVASLTSRHYQETPYVGADPFSWEKYTDQLQRDLRIVRDEN